MKLDEPYASRMREFIRELRTTSIKKTTTMLCIVGADGTRHMCAEGLLFDVALRLGMAEQGARWVAEDLTNGSATHYASDERIGDSRGSPILIPCTTRAFMLGDAGDEGLIGTIQRNGHERQYTAMTLNDSHRLSFAQIADAIERHYELAETK